MLCVDYFKLLKVKSTSKITKINCLTFVVANSLVVSFVPMHYIYVYKDWPTLLIGCSIKRGLIQIVMIDKDKGRLSKPVKSRNLNDV